MSDTLRESIARQRASLTTLLAEPMGRLADRCVAVWGDRQALNQVLSDGITDLHHCKFLYAVGPDRIQVSDNVTQKGLITTDFGRDRSHRPYMQELPGEFVLSEAYISVRANRPSLTAVQAVHRGDELLGYLGADFDLRDLPLTRELYEEPKQWRQVRGDPAIRGTVFLQTRVESMLDRFIDSALAVLEELITEHGVFHTTVHFSSSRATIWLLDDPYRYRLLDMEALDDPDMCLAYPRRDYPEQAVIPADRVRPILERFRQLRFSDETIYLRSGSINVFNGMVSLTFSCDGSHYLPYEEFLHTDMDFWGVGPVNVTETEAPDVGPEKPSVTAPGA